MKPKPENPAIAIQTFRTTLDRLMLPVELSQSGENHNNLKISIKVSAGHSADYETEQTGNSIHVFEIVGGARAFSQVRPEFKTADAGKKVPTPLLTTTNLADALIGVLFLTLNDIIAESNRFSVDKFVKENGQQHSVFCENCRELVAQADYGTTACKKCEAEQ